jgi:hypothetical protein
MTGAALLAVCAVLTASNSGAAGRRASASSQSPASEDEVKRLLVGNWTLVKYVTFGAGGEERPGGFDAGRVMYDGREMTAHLMRSGAAKAAPADDAARAAAYQAYLGYFGPYTIDTARGVVIHHVAGASFPHWIGTDQTRYYGFADNGNTLTLSLKSGARVTATLTWQRVK